MNYTIIKHPIFKRNSAAFFVLQCTQPLAYVKPDYRMRTCGSYIYIYVFMRQCVRHFDTYFRNLCVVEEQKVTDGILIIIRELWPSS